MTEVWSQSWFWPAVSVIIGLPIVLLVLSEVYRGWQEGREQYHHR